MPRCAKCAGLSGLGLCIKCGQLLPARYSVRQRSLCGVSLQSSRCFSPPEPHLFCTLDVRPRCALPPRQRAATCNIQIPKSPKLQQLAELHFGGPLAASYRANLPRHNSADIRLIQDIQLRCAGFTPSVSRKFRGGSGQQSGHLNKRLILVKNCYFFRLEFVCVFR